MTKPTLTYFDIPTSRGEECRLALFIAGVPFIDERLNHEQWAARKASTPYGALPIFSMEGKPVLAQSNAILRMLGSQHGLLPADAWESARHEGVMCSVEELRGKLGPTLRIKDEVEKKAARANIAANVLPTWAGYTEAQLGDGPFFAGAKLHVVDLKLYLAARWFKSGALDHIPTTVLDPFPRLSALHDAVRDHAGVKGWYARG